mmetsp:Transcript_9023/g.27923  ORF Transcript_9023/g.27923 Transcript_9023/m.27923 type:complete len:279 (+) Transcript_9023:210-1046(+)
MDVHVGGGSDNLRGGVGVDERLCGSLIVALQRQVHDLDAGRAGRTVVEVDLTSTDVTLSGTPLGANLQHRVGRVVVGLGRTGGGSVERGDLVLAVELGLSLQGGAERRNGVDLSTGSALGVRGRATELDVTLAVAQSELDSVDLALGVVAIGEVNRGEARGGSRGVILTVDVRRSEGPENLSGVGALGGQVQRSHGQSLRDRDRVGKMNEGNLLRPVHAKAGVTPDTAEKTGGRDTLLIGDLTSIQIDVIGHGSADEKHDSKDGKQLHLPWKQRMQCG